MEPLGRVAQVVQQELMQLDLQDLVAHLGHQAQLDQVDLVDLVVHLVLKVAQVQ